MRAAPRRAGIDDTGPVEKKVRSRVPLGAALRRVLDMGLPARADSTAPRDAPHLVRATSPTESSDPHAVGPTVGSGTDLDAFDAFYRANYPTVTRLAYSLCGSMTVAEELAQESFVAAHRRWRRIAAFDRPDLWVRRVVINRSISYRRKVASERKALLRFSKRREGDDEIVVADDQVFAALRGLSSRQSEVLALVYLEDRPIAEVAAILRLGEETVRTHLKQRPGRVGREARPGTGACLMSVEQRLYRAAHELREIEIDTPAFAPEPPSQRSRRIGGAVAAGALALVGIVGVLAIDSPSSEPAEEIATAVEQPVASLPAVDVGGATEPIVLASDAQPILTPREEISIIASLASDTPRDAEADRDDDIPTGVS